VKTVSVTELKAQLARYLRMVRRGTEVQILERGVPIARLVRVEGAATPSEDEARLERLAKSGMLRRGRGDLAWLHDEAPIVAAGANVSRALAEDREDRL
jgi:prevent-host-death family protein